jgi:hypothetical protein
MKKLSQVLFTRENLLAVLPYLILIALVIFTADTSPTWIYQGFLNACSTVFCCCGDFLPGWTVKPGTVTDPV